MQSTTIISTFVDGKKKKRHEHYTKFKPNARRHDDTGFRIKPLIYLAND